MDSWTPDPVNADIRTEIFRRLAQARPDPESDLLWTSPFELLIAVILSAQATDISVNKATATLFPVACTPEALLALGVDGVEPHVRHIGLWRNKAKNVVETSRLLLERHGGEVPDTRPALEALPGVGKKTAAVVLNVAFGQPLIAVDTHVFRVANRTRIARGKDPDEVERRLERLVPTAYLANAHHWLILHGRYTCVARTPRCAGCCIADLCEYRPKTPGAPAA